MTDTPDERSRPTLRPVPQARPGNRPTPRPRVAGSRRDREEPETAAAQADVAPAPRPAARRTPSAATTSAPGTSAAASSSGTVGTATRSRRASRASREKAAAASTSSARTGRRAGTLALVLALLCVIAAAGAAFLLSQRLNPSHVDTSVLTATRSGVEALYAYDYKDSEGSVERKLAVLTGELREQYEADLSTGGILDTYEQVSATTSYEVVDVGLQRINEAQDTATLVVFGKYVVKSATSGQEPAPEGSECEVSPDGAQACTQTVQVGVVRTDGEWKISELTLLTTS